MILSLRIASQEVKFGGSLARREGHLLESGCKKAKLRGMLTRNEAASIFVWFSNLKDFRAVRIWLCIRYS